MFTDGEWLKLKEAYGAAFASDPGGVVAGVRAVALLAVELVAARGGTVTAEQVEQCLLAAGVETPEGATDLRQHISAQGARVVVLEAERASRIEHEKEMEVLLGEMRKEIARLKPSGQVAEDVEELSETIDHAWPVSDPLHAGDHAALSRRAAGAQQAEALRGELVFCQQERDSAADRASGAEQDREALRAEAARYEEAAKHDQTKLEEAERARNKAMIDRSSVESRLAAIRESATKAAAELRHTYRPETRDWNLVARAIVILERAVLDGVAPPDAKARCFAPDNIKCPCAWSPPRPCIFIRGGPFPTRAQTWRNTILGRIAAWAVRYKIPEAEAQEANDAVESLESVATSALVVHAPVRITTDGDWRAASLRAPQDMRTVLFNVTERGGTLVLRERGVTTLDGKPQPTADETFPRTHPHVFEDDGTTGGRCGKLVDATTWVRCGFPQDAHRWPCSPTCTHSDAATPGHPERVEEMSEAVAEVGAAADGMAERDRTLQRAYQNGAEAMREACLDAALGWAEANYGMRPQGLTAAIEGAVP